MRGEGEAGGGWKLRLIFEYRCRVQRWWLCTGVAEKGGCKVDADAACHPIVASREQKTRVLVIM